MLGLILGTTIPGIGNVLGGVFGAIIGALIGFFGGVVLVALKPFVAVLGLIVGGVYTYELLGRIENNGVRLLIAAILGILTAYMVYMSFVYGIIMLVLFLILKDHSEEIKDGRRPTYRGIYNPLGEVTRYEEHRRIQESLKGARRIQV